MSLISNLYISIVHCYKFITDRIMEKKSLLHGEFGKELAISRFFIMFRSSLYFCNILSYLHRNEPNYWKQLTFFLYRDTLPKNQITCAWHKDKGYLVFCVPCILWSIGLHKAKITGAYSEYSLTQHYHFLSTISFGMSLVIFKWLKKFYLTIKKRQIEYQYFILPINIVRARSHDLYNLHLY